MCKEAPKASSTDGGAARLHAAPSIDDLERRIADGLLDLVKNCFYMHAVDLTQIRITKRDDSWLVMLKGERQGSRQVAFFNAKRFQDALVTAITSADCKKVPWRDDKPPPWEVK